MAEGIRIENLVKTYGSGDTAVHALRGVNMSVAKGEVVGLIGFAVGKIAATFWAPFFPKYVLLLPADSLRGFFAVMAICAPCAAT